MGTLLRNSYEEHLLDIFKVNRFNHATQSIWLKVTNNDENLMHRANGKNFDFYFMQIAMCMYCIIYIVYTYYVSSKYKLLPELNQFIIHS